MKEIPGYEGLYSACIDGRIYSHAKGIYIAQYKAGRDGGYRRVNLCKNGKKKQYLVHRLVVAAFIGKIPKGMQINHKDENRANNHLNNLEICTPAYNCNYGTRIERIRKKRRGA